MTSFTLRSNSGSKRPHDEPATNIMSVIRVGGNDNQGWKLQKNNAFPSEKYRKDLPVHH